MNRLQLSSTLLVLSLAVPALALDYNPPGDLVSGSGTGVTDTTVYAPNLRFPMESTPAFANSQVYGPGGFLGPGGGQCDRENYDFPWSDNYCETRSWVTPLCPTGAGHQGQDIRPATCDDNTHWVVAGENGRITSIGSYSVILTTDSGTQYRYLHLAMDRLAVSQGDTVSRGDRLGLVSNDFGGTPTTYHLHFEIHQNIASVGSITPVPTYTSLVESYEELEEPCASLPAGGGIVDDSDSACFHAFGSGTYWRPVSGYGQNGAFIWTHGFVADEPSNWARWDIDMDAAGRYKVEASNLSDWIAANGFYQSRVLRYRVRHGGMETDIVVEQGDGDGWLTLGDFDFAAGGDQWVAVYDNTGEDGGLEAKIVVDAVRLTPAGGATECNASECAAQGTCSEWSICGGFTDGCDDSGTQTRSCETYACEGGTCVRGADEVEEQACTREVTDELGDWTPTSECAGFESLCDEEGVLTETRDACVGGVSSSESRETACTRDTDGIVTSVWGPWGECDAATAEESRTRTICAAGLEGEETQARQCSGTTTGEPRPVPTVSTRSGCSSTPLPRSGFFVGLLALAAIRRRRVR